MRFEIVTIGLCAAAALSLPVWAQQTPAAPQPAAPPARAHAAQIPTPMAGGPYMGVGIMDVDDARARTLKMKETRGAEVTRVDPGGPAERAGLKVDDVILEYNGQPVQSMEQLQRLVRESVPGRAVKLGVWRNGAMQTMEVTIESRRGAPAAVTLPGGMVWGEAPDYWPAMPFPMDLPHIVTLGQSTILGVECEPLGDEQQFGEFFGVKDGLLVKKVEASSAAARAGVKAGDVIVKVDDAHVGSMRELNTALRAARQKSGYQLTVVRNKKEMTIPVQ